MTKSRETARDIVQEVFVKLWLQRTELAGKDSFRNYLFIVARNHIFSELRKRKNEHAFVQGLIDYFTERHEGADEPLLFKESAALIQEAVERLSPQQKEIYILAREKGWTQEEIAAHLGISKATIKTHMSRALTSIRLYLEDHAGGPLLVVAVVRAFL